MSRPQGAHRACNGSRPRNGLAPGISAANSNTRISAATLTSRVPGIAGGAGSAKDSAPLRPALFDNLGLNSERMRATMVQRLSQQGIDDARVLAAMRAVPRHVFVDQGLASRAYEDAALPIGHGQTISQPWIVARMLSVACAQRQPRRVLEVGAGCGYQAAVLAQLVPEVYTIERIGALCELARANLQNLAIQRVTVRHGDGMLGLAAYAPFDAIVVAAAGLEIPQALLAQLAPGARLVAPEGGSRQTLICVERIAPAEWRRTELEAVRFVPLKAGIQS